MDIEEKNARLRGRHWGARDNWWFRGRFDTVPYEEERERRLNLWFRDARLGLFFHWSPSAQLGRGGSAVLSEEMPPGDWREMCLNWQVRDDFVEEWIRLAVDGGMKYVVFTTNHCDAFCMWDTETTGFNSVNHGPERDLIGECLEAAREAGLKVGLYYSPSEPFPHLDPRYVGEDTPPAGRREFLAETAERPRWAARWRERALAQIEELLSNYGPIDLWWHDGPLPPHLMPPEETLELMRRLQPDMVVNDRICSDPVPADFATQDYFEELTRPVAVGAPGRDWEVGMPINMSWNYAPGALVDTASLRGILHVLYHCIAEQGNLLLSVAPLPDGSVDAPASERIRELGRWVRRHEEVVYGHFPRAIRCTDDGRIVQYVGGGSKVCKWILRDPRTAYLWVRWWPGADPRLDSSETFELPVGQFQHTLRGATMVPTGEPVEFEQTGTRLVFRDLPADCPDSIGRLAVMKLEFEPGLPWA